MSVSSGTYDFGSGGAYSTLGAALNDSTDLTGNLTFRMVSDTNETSNISWSHNTNGYTLRITSSLTHLGLPASAWKMSINQVSGGRVFDLYGASGATGLIQIDSLYLSVVTVQAAFWILFGLQVPAFGSSLTQSYILKNCLFDLGNKSNGSAIFSFANGGAAPCRIWNNKIWNSGGATGITVQKDSDVVENNVFYSTVNATGFSGDRFSTLQNNACYAPGGNAFAWPATFGAHATSRGNASSDSTSTNAATQSGNYTGRAAATDLISTNPASSDFLKPADLSVLKTGGVTPSISFNTEGVEANSRPSAGGILSIGAHQAIDAKSILIAGIGFRFRPWPKPTITASIQWIQDSAGYWNGSDRGYAQDVYEATALFQGRESVINTLEQTLESNRESIVLSGFEAPLFAPNVDHTGTITAAVLEIQRRQVQFGLSGHVYELVVTFRAIAPTLLSTTPSMAGLRPQEGFSAQASYESPKAFAYGQTAYYGDHRSDTGTLEVDLVQNLAQTRAILAYVLTTARASAVAFPSALSTIAYPWGRARGSATNCKITGLEVSRMNLNRWKIKLRFVEAP